MTVLSGRAGLGARQVARTLLGGVFVALGLIAGGCGNNIFTYGTPIITLSTTAGPFTAYVVAIDQIYLTRDDNTIVYPVTTASGLPQVVDLAKYNDRTEIYGAPAVIEGNYLSATITLDYTNAQIFANVNGTSKKLTVNDANSTTSPVPALTTVTYTVKFDPAHPLVIKNGVSSPIDFNFDLSASTAALDTTALTVLTRPVLTANTQPIYTQPLRTRGIFVTADVNNSNFTINSRGFFDTYSNPAGAIEIDTDANTTYNINGVVYTGSAGMQAVQAQQINVLVEAFGSFGSLNSIKPHFKATQVYVGDTADDLNRIRVSGMVAARSGNTLTMRSAEVLTPYTPTGIGVALAVNFYDTVTVTISDQTAVTVDGRADIAHPTTQLISVGQQLDIDGVIPAQGTTFNGVIDATAGFARLKQTTAWGLLNATPQAGSPTMVNLISLGGSPASTLTFTGTGSVTDATAAAYLIDDTSGVDLSGVALNTAPVRFDGLVTAFGGAPPDMTATAAVAGSNTDQLLVVDWVNGGSANPFVSVASDGLTVNMSDANRGTSHFVQTGPAYIQTTQTTIDLTSPLVNPKIVPDTSGTAGLQFTIGNSSTTTGYAGFNSYASFQTQVSTVLNGTNKISKLVAVGKWDGATFTAHRIDIVQLP